jgi:hypothetical protein
VDKTVENGIGQSGVWESGMPIRDGDLSGDDRGGSPEAVVEYFEQVLRRGEWDRIAQPVIKDQDIDPG